MKLILSAVFWLAAAAAAAQVPCGGSWRSFLQGVRSEAQARGLPAYSVEAILAGVNQSRKVLARDRAQGVFRQSFLEFSGRAVSAFRLKRAKEMRKRYAAVFDEEERRFGVPREVILAFWAMETDFGAVTGDIHTVSALATLAHDCRRPEIFRPQLFGAMALHARGDFGPDTTGAWAGEIGHVQMLPGDILELGVDGDGDGHVRMKSSAPDAILTAANMLSHHGWRRGEPWLVEVTAPAGLDWSQTGMGSTRSVREWERLGVKPRSGSVAGNLPAALILPQGRKGPKFLVFHNFTDVFLEWNKSLVNTLTAAYLATRIGGAERYLKGNPEPKLPDEQMMLLQRRLAARGHDVGAIDGILGALTRAAVRSEQARLGLPADGWPTAALLAALR
ncbi:MAG: lytic murein transglycosylase [Paracoccaceae bacterium]